MFKRIVQLSQLITFSELRNALLGMSVVFGGLGLALITLYAHLRGDPSLAGVAAAASLVFVFLIIVFVIPPLARNASAEASQLNLPFEFTTGGAIFLGLLVIVGFAAWNTANNLLFLVLSFITAGLIIGFLVGHFGLKRLDVKMRFPETVYVNEPTPIVLSLHSRKRIFPTFSVTAEVRGRRPQAKELEDKLREFLPAKWAARIAKPPLIKHTLDYFIHIPRLGEVQNQLDHVFEKRGRFEIKDFELSTKFPFAIFRHRRRLPAQRAEIVVFPKHREVGSDILQVPIENGNAVSKKKGLGRDLIGMREYQPLDDLRHIDWKATARSGSMIVRDFAADDELRVLIILDTRIVKSASEKAVPLRKQIENMQRGIQTGESQARLDTAVGKACFLLSHFFEMGAEIGLIMPGSTLELDEGREHFLICMRNAAKALPVFVDSHLPGDFEQQISEMAESLPACHVFLLNARESRIRPDGIRGCREIKF
ncbi:MAG: DUF58 domain-containing protein [Acidobacteriota bacterium]|nr:DUF58 domain-containing protein [Acidobacteriota bacterium]MDH3529726.1 DUF58 domain-containing protein [Acidobacteriota bacterium]